MSETKLTRRQQQAEETKKRIYSTTMNLAAEYGLNQINISEICRGAGVSIGTFYNHYISLDFIILEGYRYDKYIENKIAETPLEGRCIDKICHLFKLKMEFIVNYGVEFMIQLFKSNLEQVKQENNVFLDNNRIMPVMINELLEEGVEYGEIRVNIELEELTKFILIYSRGITYDWCIRNGNYDLIETTQRAMLLYLNQFKNI